MYMNFIIEIKLLRSGQALTRTNELQRTWQSGLALTPETSLSAVGASPNSHEKCGRDLSN